MVGCFSGGFTVSKVAFAFSDRKALLMIFPFPLNCQLLFQHLVVLPFIKNILFLAFRVVIMENHFNDFHRVIFDFLNFRSRDVMALPSPILFLFDESVPVLKSIFFEVVI